MKFSESDLQQLAQKGISKEKVLDQIETFKEGIPFVRLEKAAVVGDGIARFSPAEVEALIDIFEQSRKHLSLLKFVPASGAASRMFKALFNFLETYDPSREGFKDYVHRTGSKDIKALFEQWESLPFYSLIQERIKDIALSKDEEKYLFVKEMLSEDRLNYGFYPKGLLPFHVYDDYVVTAFEEHMKEATRYSETDGKARLHFTISPQHEFLFKKEFEIARARLRHQTGVDFEVTFSFQKPATDTIAVDMGNNAFRDTDGSILFRPGGHGALIENLDEQEADIIFIKNIDNVVPARSLDVIVNSKKVLAGALLKVQGKIFEYAKLMENGIADASQLIEIKQFLEKELNVRFSDSFDHFSLSEQIKVLQDKMNRPIRVCGMVKNEGEPGGGPFWVTDTHGNISLQIVESAQVDRDDEKQASILKSSTHFNPVDLVCGVKNHKGEKYDLLKFVDASLGFITGKTQEGRELKALELPGLWNGAMAYWNTLFVEVPITTFNPVKTVNDLLRPSHQP
ncbi:DUF4301 family protein [Flavobacteriaceae bacterium TP-CH-4]|uniref:DUF4301 family protein n=1 Tax=Pelagihabitans pacificus TaxID=2696054 RepID=A0A967ARA8_9FLAO|nr:DUF4301 family protein [Pelagihabitans pacificus]NHF58719.1 DUF4301 family protein [Pelagihabitans pacificus]